MDALFTEPRDAKITVYPLRDLEKPGRLFQHPVNVARHWLPTLAAKQWIAVYRYQSPPAQ